PLQDPVGPPAIGPSTVYIHAPSPIVLGVMECVKKSYIGCELAWTRVYVK
ncbi:hypothetical protein A2U01_0062910, partial [Trifolium medium]|nr:hypothetical protein [Trifolium medium]